MNRKRKPTESYKEYKANLKMEALAIKQHLRGRYLWVSHKGAKPYRRSV